MDVSAHARGQIHPPSAFLFYSGPEWIRRCPSTLVRANFFTEQTDSSTTLFQKHLPQTPRNNVLPAIWASLSSVRLTHKINHHTGLFWWTRPSEHILGRGCWKHLLKRPLLHPLQQPPSPVKGLMGEVCPALPSGHKTYNF